MSTTEVESVWDYPRPPRLERSARLLRIVHGGEVIAKTTNAWRILETSHPPVYYIPQADLAMQFLVRSQRRSSFCEWKGYAAYWSLDLRSVAPGSALVTDAAWSYPDPTASYAGLRDHLAFYASRVDECTVDGERVQAQPGDFYGGWITSHVRGPFKGAPGTLGW
ncbi:MAG: DUF427 domain-containing protein [Janthinobacterium lividum]